MATVMQESHEEWLMTERSSSPEFDAILAKTLESICKYACETTGAEHSGFVRFDHNREAGEVVAQYPPLEGLLKSKIKLRGVPAEEDLLKSDDPLVIEDVANAGDLGEVGILLMSFGIKSICIAKVKLRGNVIGSISFDSIKEKRAFSSKEIALCRSLAELASSLIEKTWQDEWIKSFRQATVAINVEQEAAPLLKAIISQASLLFKAQSVGLYLRRLDEHGDDSLWLAASSTEELTGKSLRMGEGMAWQLINSDEPFMSTSNYETYPHRAESYEGKFGSVLEVPLLQQGERVGVLYLSDIRGRIFTEFDAQSLQQYADTALIALQHCNLVSRMKDLTIASAEMSGSTDAETLLARLTQIARNATTILKAEMCGVFRVEMNKLILQASWGHAPGFFTQGRQFEIRDEPKCGLTGAMAARFIAGHARRVAERRPSAKAPTVFKRPVFNLCGDLLRDPAMKGGERDATPSGRCYSLLAIPLIAKYGDVEQVSGMLRISNKKGIDGVARDSICFNEEDELVLRVFAEAVVVSIESAELSEQRLQLSESLETKNNLYSQLLSYAEEREANLRDLALYNAKCGILMHNQDQRVRNLKQQVIKVQDAIAKDMPGEMIKTMFSAIASRAEALEDFYSSNHKELKKSRMNLAELAIILQADDPELQAHGIAKRVHILDNRDDMVEVDEFLIRHVFMIFINNSMNAMKNGHLKELYITLGGRPEGWCAIRFADTGNGMSVDTWTQIADEKSPRKAGKGLRSALLIVKAFGGQINLAETSHNGTTFEIRLPRVNRTAGKANFS